MRASLSFTRQGHLKRYFELIKKVAYQKQTYCLLLSLSCSSSKKIKKFNDANPKWVAGTLSGFFHTPSILCVPKDAQTCVWLTARSLCSQKAGHKKQQFLDPGAKKRRAIYFLYISMYILYAANTAWQSWLCNNFEWNSLLEWISGFIRKCMHKK